MRDMFQERRSGVSRSLPAARTDGRLLVFGRLPFGFFTVEF
jgi:hypothetical protein